MKTTPFILPIFALFCLTESAFADPSTSSQLNTADRAQSGIVAFTGAHFQSCAPLLNPNEDPVETMRDYWGEDESYTRQNRCTDRRDANFNYVSFMVGSMNPSAGQLKSRRGKLNAFGRFNCSGFVAGTLAAAGLKYHQNQSSRTFSPTTHELRSVFKRSDTCFYKPELSRDRSLLPGDIINLSAGHVVTVLSVGDDPLGLKDVSRKSDCDSIKKSNLDFVIAHSSSNQKGDFSGVRVEEAKNASTSMMKKLAKYAKSFCRDTFSSGLTGTLPDVKVGEKTYGVWPFQIKRPQVFALRRHYGEAKPNCAESTPQVRGKSCLRSACYEQVRATSYWNH